MYYVYWIIIGIVAGFIASKIVNHHGEGVLLDLLLGLVGAFIGGWLFARLGINAVSGMLGSMITATVGAIVLLLVVRLFR
jgi:uncharacterized membrane protein YeaQ/YmgE (transglycosylase-associated protein family)